MTYVNENNYNTMILVLLMCLILLVVVLYLYYHHKHKYQSCFKTITFTNMMKVITHHVQEYLSTNLFNLSNFIIFNINKNYLPFYSNTHQKASSKTISNLAKTHKHCSTNLELELLENSNVIEEKEGDLNFNSNTNKALRFLGGFSPHTIPLRCGSKQLSNLKSVDCYLNTSVNMII